MDVCAVILAGGQSSRMGENKALLSLQKKTVIEHIRDELKKLTKHVIVISSDAVKYSFLNVPVFKDLHPGQGPLAGLESALINVNAEHFVVSACDTPFINEKVYTHLLRTMGGHDAVIPEYDGNIHPLSGVYHRRILSAIQVQISNKDLKIRNLFQKISIKYEQDFNCINNELLKRHFFNMNNRADYEQAKNDYYLF